MFPIATWHVQPTQKQFSSAFMVGDYLPKLNSLGLELTDAWVTVYGDEPQILVGAVMPSVETAKTLISSPEWQALNDQLLELVDHYVCKIAPQKGAFQF